MSRNASVSTLSGCEAGMFVCVAGLFTLLESLLGELFHVRHSTYPIFSASQSGSQMSDLRACISAVRLASTDIHQVG
jgi:hypothetical protein